MSENVEANSRFSLSYYFKLKQLTFAVTLQTLVHKSVWEELEEE